MRKSDGLRAAARGPFFFPETMMHLVQLLLPLRDNEGNAFPRKQMDAVRRHLTETFGGVTAYLRAPAKGAWKDDEGDVARDDVVIVEVMAEELDRGWWADYRRALESDFRQDEIVIRATPMERL